MIYGDIEQKKEAIRAATRNYRNAAAAIPAIKRVVTTFDGKQYNKRFDDAVASIELPADGRVFVTNHFEWFEIHYQPRDIYLITGYTCIASDSHVAPEDQRPESIFFDGKKILADKINAALMDEREKLLAAAFRLEQEADNLEMYLTRIEAAKKVLAECVDSLSRDTRDVCGLDRCRYY